MREAIVNPETTEKKAETEVETEVKPKAKGELRIQKRLQALSDRFLKSTVSRRSFLKYVTLGTTTAAVATVAKVNVAEAFELPDLFRAHYKELTPEEKVKLFKKLEAETKKKHGVDVTIKDYPERKDVKFVYALNLTKCIGCRKCVDACVKENNQSRDPQIQYIKVLEMENGSFNLEKSNQHYDPETVPQKGKFYMPVQCQHCDNPPCVKACPVEATWKASDGIVEIDYEWCIGCRYCQAACPYEARHFNFATPQIPPEEINPNQGYLSNRIRPYGVVEKCNFCSHRTRQGLLPACLEVCPTGSRKFGNILDPESEVSIIMREKRIYVLKEELNTMPSFIYFFD